MVDHQTPLSVIADPRGRVGKGLPRGERRLRASCRSASPPAPVARPTSRSTFRIGKNRELGRIHRGCAWWIPLWVVVAPHGRAEQLLLGGNDRSPLARQLSRAPQRLLPRARRSVALSTCCVTLPTFSSWPSTSSNSRPTRRVRLVGVGVVVLVGVGVGVGGTVWGTVWGMGWAHQGSASSRRLHSICSTSHLPPARESPVLPG
eukprot:scaffold26811_cov31-Phaeocystis_antarctica.AAC.1